MLLQMGMIRQLSPHTPPDVCQACIHLAAMGNQAGYDTSISFHQTMI
jgi:hypothetical protein